MGFIALTFFIFGGMIFLLAKCIQDSSKTSILTAIIFAILYLVFALIFQKYPLIIISIFGVLILLGGLIVGFIKLPLFTKKSRIIYIISSILLLTCIGFSYSSITYNQRHDGADGLIISIAKSGYDYSTYSESGSQEKVGEILKGDSWALPKYNKYYESNLRFIYKQISLSDDTYGYKVNIEVSENNFNCDYLINYTVYYNTFDNKPSYTNSVITKNMIELNFKDLYNPSKNEFTLYSYDNDESSMVQYFLQSVRKITKTDGFNYLNKVISKNGVNKNIFQTIDMVSCNKETFMRNRSYLIITSSVTFSLSVVGYVCAILLRKPKISNSDNYEMKK